MKTIPVLSEEDINEIKSELDKVDKYLPLVELVVDKLLLSGPFLGRVVRAISDGIVKNRFQSIKLYTELGLTHEDAIQMTLSDISNIRFSMNQFNDNYASYNRSKEAQKKEETVKIMAGLLDKSNSRDVDSLLNAVNKLAEVAKAVLDK